MHARVCLLFVFSYQQLLLVSSATAPKSFWWKMKVGHYWNHTNNNRKKLNSQAAIFTASG